MHAGRLFAAGGKANRSASFLQVEGFEPNQVELGAALATQHTTEPPLTFRFRSPVSLHRLSVVLQVTLRCKDLQKTP